jgi:hypothetical protein
LLQAGINLTKSLSWLCLQFYDLIWIAPNAPK